MKINSDTDKVWELLKSYSFSDCGAAAMMGNLYAESGIIPNRLEELCRKRLIENTGKNWSDDEYTRALDSGDLTREQFLHPLPGKQYGYGLAQWTSPGRKGTLYDRCKSKGKSIGDLEEQVAFLYSEISQNYQTVLKVCINAETVKEASDVILIKYESPASAESMKAVREKYGLFYLDAYKEKKMSYTINKVIETAAAEIGYLEKKSNSNLDNKTANAGSNNYTKFGRDLHAWFPELGATFAVNYQWCQMFVDWCFYKAYGKDGAKTLLGGFTGYTPTGAGYFKNKGRYYTRGTTTPKKGDVIYFHGTVSGVYRICHTGIVYKCEGNTVYTIEGNTNNGSEVISNGGSVCYKSYALNNTRIDGYGRPDYGQQDNATPAVSSSNVADYQKFLNTNYPGLVKQACGALLNIDGQYGNLTRNASLIVWKQMANKYYGAKLTLGNNNFFQTCSKYAGYMTDTEIGKHPTLAKILQGILAGKKYYNGNIDGIMGVQTKNAVASFQKAIHLVSTGTMNTDTWYKLFN